MQIVHMKHSLLPNANLVSFTGSNYDIYAGLYPSASYIDPFSRLVKTSNPIIRILLSETHNQAAFTQAQPSLPAGDSQMF
jgi:hypothetical protein